MAYLRLEKFGKVMLLIVMFVDMLVPAMCWEEKVVTVEAWDVLSANVTVSNVSNGSYFVSTFSFTNRTVVFLGFRISFDQLLNFFVI